MQQRAPQFGARCALCGPTRCYFVACGTRFMVLQTKFEKRTRARAGMRIGHGIEVAPLLTLEFGQFGRLVFSSASRRLNNRPISQSRQNRCVCVCGSCVVVRVVALSGLLVTNVNRSMQRMSALAGNGAFASARSSAAVSK